MAIGEPDGAPGPAAPEPVERFHFGDADRLAPPEPPDQPAPRPALIEFVSAVLIISGVIRLFALTVAVMAGEGRLEVPAPVVAIEVGIQAVTAIIGVLVRYARAWLVAVNVVAILAFLEILRLPSPVAIAFGALFGLSFVAIFANKPWFDAVRAWRAAAGARGGRAR